MVLEEDTIVAERDLDMKARVLIETGRICPHLFSKNGRTFGPLVSFQSQRLVRDLLKLGLFSMNLHSMALIEEAETGTAVFSKVPAALLAMGFHYAITIAPGEDGPEPGVRNILIDDLERHVARIEETFGPIDIDVSLIARVAITSREMALAPDGLSGGGYGG